MKEYETIKLYGKTLNEWNHVVPVSWRGKTVEAMRTVQVELAYTEYGADGRKVSVGSEDFSTERLHGLKHYRVFTWDGEKRNRGGYRWFEERLCVRIDPKQRKRLADLCKVWFPNAALIELRGF